MSELGPAEIGHVARIARLALTPEEQASFARDAATILRHFEVVMRAGESQAPPSDVGSVPARPDEVVQPDPAQVEAIVAQFPKRDGPLCKVPGGL